MADNSNDLRQQILTNELGGIMLDMVAPVYGRSKVALYLFQAFGITLLKEYDFIWIDFVDQMFIETATWGIPHWEKIYNLKPDATWGIEQRRQNILSALQYKAPITPKKIKDRLEALTGLKVDVKETGANTIKVIIETYTPDFAAVNEILDRILPAHLYYETNVEDIVNSQVNGYVSVLVNESETVNVQVLT